MQSPSTIFEIIKTARPGFWPTHLWFYMLPFAGRDMFASIPFWAGAVYVCFPLGLLTYGWNDLGDTQTDSVNPRKDSWLFGALPNAELRKRLPWIIIATQLPFLFIFTWIAGPKMFGWFAALIICNACYNTFGFKRLPVLDLLNQVGYVLIFVLASWLCDVPQLNAPAMIFGAIFAMQSHLFGQLMDLDEDKIAGRKSTAVVIGVIPAKLLLVTIMVALALIAYRYFHLPVVAIFMTLGAMFFFLDMCFGPRRYPVWFSTSFFIAWNAVVILSMHFVWRYGIFLTS
jgi:4-hydroxybenzoate polyprenyltransferase